MPKHPAKLYNGDKKEREKNPTPRLPAGTPASKRYNIMKPQPNTNRDTQAKEKKLQDFPHSSSLGLLLLFLLLIFRVGLVRVAF